MNKLRAITIALALNFVTGHIAYWNTPNHLHTVHGLYIKPSVDGTPGDLYVAASEDNGVKTQWLTSQPVNYLPVAPGQQTATPITYSTSVTSATLPHEESVITNQKRAVITSPTVQYTYPVPTEGKTVPYLYSALPTYVPSAQPVKNSEGPKECSEATTTPTYSQYSPYHYYYPQMVSALANAMNVLKEAGLSDDTASSVISQAAPMWPLAYPYPVQYLMVDPKAAWAQQQAATAPAAAAASETAQPNASATTLDSNASNEDN